MIFLCRSSTRLIRSYRAGVGKSLQYINIINKLRTRRRIQGKDVTIPVYRKVSTDDIIASLKDVLGTGYNDGCDTIHIDIAHEVSFYRKFYTKC